MKKLIIIPFLMILAMSFAFAVLDSDSDYVNITFNYPTDKIYNSSAGPLHTNLKLPVNITVAFSSASAGMNITNITYVFTQGTNVTLFFNNTINGSRTSTKAGDFTIQNLSFGNLSEGTYDFHVVVWNTSTSGYSNAFTINSSKITFVLDRTSPSIVLERPSSGQTLTPSNQFITFEYTPRDTNFGNCSIYAGGRKQTSSTSGTTNSNVSSGGLNKFSLKFTGDNASMPWLVECMDLAGNVANSSANTLNVLVSGSSNVVLPSGQVISGAGQEYIVDSQGRTIAVSNSQTTPQGGGNNAFAWIAGIAVVAVILYFVLIWKPK